MKKPGEFEVLPGLVWAGARALTAKRLGGGRPVPGRQALSVPPVMVIFM